MSHYEADILTNLRTILDHYRCYGYLEIVVPGVTLSVFKDYDGEFHVGRVLPHTSMRTLPAGCIGFRSLCQLSTFRHAFNFDALSVAIKVSRHGSISDFSRVCGNELAPKDMTAVDADLTLSQLATTFRPCLDDLSDLERLLREHHAPKVEIREKIRAAAATVLELCQLLLPDEEEVTKPNEARQDASMRAQVDLGWMLNPSGSPYGNAAPPMRSSESAPASKPRQERTLPLLTYVPREPRSQYEEEVEMPSSEEIRVGRVVGTTAAWLCQCQRHPKDSRYSVVVNGHSNTLFSLQWDGGVSSWRLRSPSDIGNADSPFDEGEEQGVFFPAMAMNANQWSNLSSIGFGICPCPMGDLYWNLSELADATGTDLCVFDLDADQWEKDVLWPFRGMLINLLHEFSTYGADPSMADQINSPFLRVGELDKMFRDQDKMSLWYFH